MNTSTLNPTFSPAYFERTQLPRAVSAPRVAQMAVSGKKRGEWTHILRKVSHFMGDSRASWASAGALSLNAEHDSN